MPKDEQRMFSVTFFIGDTIKTKIESRNVKPMEAIALLELAKDQMMIGLRDSTKNVVSIRK